MSASTVFSSLPEALYATVAKYPNHLALSDPPSLSKSTYTYTQMRQTIESIAQMLLELDVQKGDRVGLISAGRSWWPICDFAIMATGAVTVPVYPNVPASQIGFIVRHAGMAGVFVENKALYETLLKTHFDEPLALSFVVILQETDLADVKQRAPWPTFSYAAWCQAQVREEVGRLPVEIRADDMATIVYTSGTTGTPKGVILTHGNILANFSGIRQRLVLEPTDVHLSYLPLCHIFERTCGQYVPLLSGASICYAECVDTIVQDFARVRPTVFTTVPRLLEKMQERVEAQMAAKGGIQLWVFRRALAAGTRARIDKEAVSPIALQVYEQLVYKKIRKVLGGRLRICFSGGAPLAKHVGQFFLALGLSICEGYGMTETSPVIAFNIPGQPRLGTVGQRLRNVEVRLAEDDELLVRGASVTPGYYRNPEANEEAFTEDGWFKTGDIATLSADGYIAITDRKKHLLVLSTGKKVTPAPIESDILQSAWIEQACLVGQGRKFVAVIVVPSDQLFTDLAKTLPADKAQIAAFLQDEVARCTAHYAQFEQPKRVIVANEPFTVENGLLTPTLKVKNTAVYAAYQNEINHIYDHAVDPAEKAHPLSHINRTMDSSPPGF